MGETTRRWMRAAGVSVHGQIARRRWLAKRYLSAAGSLSKRLPDALAKRRLVNLLRVSPWPSVTFPPQVVRVASGLPLRLVPHAGEFDFDALFFNTLDYEAEVFAVLQPRLANYDAVVEIGANVGLYTLFFAALLGAEGRSRPVFAFEPSPEAFARLLENVRVNGARNVRAFNCAVSTVAGPVEFFEPRGHLTNGSLRRAVAALFADEVDRRIVPAVDGRFIEQLLRPFERVLIKIDVEGAEVTVLRSLESVIVSKRPDIALEVLPLDVDDLRQVDFIHRLYRRFSITDRGLVPTPQFEANDRFRDCLLVPVSAPRRGEAGLEAGDLARTVSHAGASTTPWGASSR
jgi:FkbM family methyltransferase